MDKQNQRLSILLADDEIGAYLQVAELTSGHIDDSNKDILCTAIKESNINQISQATGVVLEPYTIDSVKRAADSQKLESVCSALLPYLQMVNNKIASWQEQLERASNDEEKKRFEGYIESAARAQAATDQLQNAMDKALKGLPFEITFCGKLERALTTLSKGEKHHFDVVISDWRFQGSGSSLGGLLVLLAAELNKEDGAYIEKGFYTGYAGILTGSLDTRYIRDYVLKTHGFHELDKFQLEEGIKTLSENVAIGYITNKRRAPFITLERTEEALQSALSSSDKVGTAKKTTILLNEQDDYKMTLYHLFPFLFTDAQRGAAVDERRDKILDAIQQSKRQHGRGIVSGLYNRTKGFTHTDIQNKIIDEKVSFNARDCFAKWLEVTPIISSFCNRAKPSLTPMDCVKEELETKFNALGEALKSGSESIVCEKLLNLKKAMRLRFDVKPQV
ncbi:MAG: hypothetical protein H8D67_09220, partial [Deltaproteobacteria bacterium]|nr:hypothetical protein [Deltaproteobacteria bacterium]